MNLSAEKIIRKIFLREKAQKKLKEQRMQKISRGESLQKNTHDDEVKRLAFELLETVGAKEVEFFLQELWHGGTKPIPSLKTLRFWQKQTQGIQSNAFTSRSNDNRNPCPCN